MDDLDYWRIPDELSLYQAANLTVGLAPGEMEAAELDDRPVTKGDAIDYHTRIHAVMSALLHAARRGGLPAALRTSDYSPCEYFEEADIHNSTVLVDDLRNWLRTRGVRTGFFFPTAELTPEYLTPSHPRYAPKLAAAVSAWLAVNDPKGKPPKQALIKWLRQNAAQFDLCDEDGKPNETGIEECAKVANWRREGGAPRTSGGS